MDWKSIILVNLLLTTLTTCGQELLGRAYTDKYEISIYGRYYTQSEATQACSSKHSRLIKVDSPDIANAIKSKLRQGWKYWIGATDSSQEGHWKWLNGANLKDGYTNWNDGEPNNYANEDCAVVYNEKWNDVWCSDTLSFICQKDLPVEVRRGPHIFELHRLNEERTTFFTAFERCKNENSRLVEVHDEEVNIYLKNQLKKDSSRFYWTGGSDLQTEGRWKWNNNTVVQVFGWAGGQPDERESEDCLIITRNGWFDYGCRAQLSYICEKVGANDIKVSAKDIEVGTEKANKISCTADGHPNLRVSWVFNGVDVSLNASKSVFQAKTGKVSILRTSGATLYDEGIYICWANNTVAGTPYKVHADSMVKVPSRPITLDVFAHSCNTSLVVSWSPNKRASRIPHRIVISSSNGHTVMEIYSIPETDPPSLSHDWTRNLSSWTEYTVAITPCPTATQCKTEYSVSKTVRTAGIPGKVKKVVTKTISPTSCEMTWLSPEGVPVHAITGYQINITEVVADEDNGHKESVTSKKISRISTSYKFEGKPNRRYSFGIHAKTCAGSGPIIWCRQTCNTSQQAPTTVQTPTLRGKMNNAGEINITVQRPDQANGAISCLFVVVKLDDGNTTNNRTTYTLNDLIKANRSISVNDTAHDYISVSLVAPRMAEPEFNVVLGDESISSCDVNLTNPTRRRRSIRSNSTIVGHNLKLDPNKNYSIFIVSTTPSRVGVLLKASEMQSTQQQQENSGRDDSTDQGNHANQQLWTILAAIGGCVVFVFLVIGLVLMNRRFAAKQMIHQSPREHNRPIPALPVERLEPTVVYQNAIVFAEEEQDSTGTQIPMQKFEEVYQSMLTKDGEKFTKQFEELMKDAMAKMGTTEIASKPEHKKKNRYKNILPFDNTRVTIKNNDSGYINACFIDGFEHQNKFIATQGPLPATVLDFWLMVVEQNCAVIVMLAKCFEAGKKKCEKYWPDHRDTAQFGPITVSNRKEVKFCGFIRRTLSVTASIKDEIIEMTVSQYHFLTWPDHGVPPTTSHLIRMHKEAMQNHRTFANDFSVIVHCSAGAGRSGTFIAYDILLNRSRKMKSADVYNSVLKMRKQRVDMVQNCDQYILVNKLLLESFLFGDTDLTAPEAMEKFGDIDYRMEVASKQFANLSRVEPMHISFKNRREKLSPYDRMKVVVAGSDGEGNQQAIDASFVESYDESTRMIASAGPTAENAEYFWRMILDNNVSVLVTLPSGESHSTGCWPSNVRPSLKFGDISLKLEEGQSAENFGKKVITVKGFDRMVCVVHLQVVGNMDESFPKDGRKIIKVVDEMQKVLRESEFPVALIHCRNGSGTTGAFCAIVNLIERLKVENRVDVFRAVKDLRDCRMRMVESLEQYILCHQAVIDYLNSFDVYSNFK